MPESLRDAMEREAQRGYWAPEFVRGAKWAAREAIRRAREQADEEGKYSLAGQALLKFADSLEGALKP